MIHRYLRKSVGHFLEETKFSETRQIFDLFTDFSAFVNYLFEMSVNVKEERVPNYDFVGVSDKDILFFEQIFNLLLRNEFPSSIGHLDKAILKKEASNYCVSNIVVQSKIFHLIKF